MGRVSQYPCTLLTTTQVLPAGISVQVKLYAKTLVPDVFLNRHHCYNQINGVSTYQCKWINEESADVLVRHLSWANVLGMGWALFFKQCAWAV
eukprot:c29453_g1_i1 orf=254-532(+)